MRLPDPDPCHPVQRPPEPSAGQPEAGSALMIALVFMTIVVGAVLTHSTELLAHRKRMETRQRMQSLADTIAQSGLTDATAWFRRQVVQPVQTYQPARDETAAPPVLETMDPDLGLVREFQVRGSLWGRYEVRRDEAHDISALRGADGPGQVWDVASRGLLFNRRDATVPFDTRPNRVVAATSLRSELRGIPMALPASAAIILPRPAKLLVQSGNRIDGGGSPAFAFDADLRLLDPMPLLAGIATGTPIDTVVPNLDLSPEAMFGMRIRQLAQYADINMQEATDAALSRPLHDKILFSPGNLTLAAGKPLLGRVLLVVGGDLTILSGNGSDLEGLIYVAGSVNMQGPFKLRGSMVVVDELRLDSNASNPVSMAYSQDALSGLRDSLSRYRKAPPLPTLPSAQEEAFLDTSTLLEDTIETVQPTTERVQGTNLLDLNR